ncbi:MAG: bifunctional glutamate N-acetyltransferase/amino-acid acetyltransferase ArgJ [Clostridiales bacterium]|nr:bifunctional glutamate N-acetyltransferase/amino-acid acetyltransferase ArgJ [Clostridiales bacterium]
MLEQINGGVCAPKGYKANGIHCGIRANKTKKDLALVVSEKRAAAAAVYTTNLVQGAPIAVCREHLADGYAQAMICNSGIANTCAVGGKQAAEDMCRLVEEYTGVSASDVIVASTGVIGQPLNIEPIRQGMPALASGLSTDATAAAEGIMTTDTHRKEAAVVFTIGGKRCVIGGMAKGSGMIHPNMATMLVFLTTDCAIMPALLQKALSEDITDTFNMVSVDGDTSTNDMVSIMANGLAENPVIDSEGVDFDTFKGALRHLTTYLCRQIAGDGEGATKLLECRVSGAKDVDTAKKVAKSVICSSLTKSAMFGADANWGRVLCAIGYAGVPVTIAKTAVSFKSRAGEICVCQNGEGVSFSEELAKKILLEDEIEIIIALQDGEGTASAWGCDLTYDYVKINGDYRT